MVSSLALKARPSAFDDGPSGSFMMKVVPFPGTELTSIDPPA